MQLLGVKFAPIVLPLQRRLQTLSIASLVFCLSAGLFVCPFLALYLFFFTNYYWLITVYILWIVYDARTCETGGRRSDKIRNLFVWKHVSDYFPANLVRDSEKPFDPNKNYFFICHPHGIWCAGIISNMAIQSKNWNALFPNIRPHVIGLRALFFIPFFRDLILSLGVICASKKSINHIFSRKSGTGNAVALMVGGAAESLNSHPNNYRIILRSRKGFLQLAMRNGVPLVPVITFGEVDLYTQFSNPPGSLLRKCQDQLRKFTGFAPIVFNGRGMFQYSVGLLPQRTPLTTVVGEPIDVECIAEPSKEQISALQSKFINSISALFEKHKHTYLKNADDIRLQID